MKHGMGCLEKSLEMVGCQSRCSGRRVCTVDDVEEPNEIFQNDPRPLPPGKLRPSKSKKSDSTRPPNKPSREAFKEMVQEELQQECSKKLILSTLKINSRN